MEEENNPGSGTVRVVESWTVDGEWLYRKIGHSRWERVPNLYGQVPFIKRNFKETRLWQ